MCGTLADDVVSAFINQKTTHSEKENPANKPQTPQWKAAMERRKFLREGHTFWTCRWQTQLVPQKRQRGASAWLNHCDWEWGPPRELQGRRRLEPIPGLKWKLLTPEIQFILSSYCICSRSTHLLGFSPILVHLERNSSSDHLWCSTHHLMWSSTAFPLEDLLPDSIKKPPKHTKPNLNQTKSLSVFLSEFCSPSCHNPSKNKATQPIQKHGFPRSMKWMVLNRVSITLTHKYRKAVSLQAVSHVGAEESVVHALYCRQTQSPSCATTRGKHIPTHRTWPR